MAPSITFDLRCYICIVQDVYAVVKGKRLRKSIFFCRWCEALNYQCFADALSIISVVQEMDEVKNVHKKQLPLPAPVKQAQKAGFLRRRREVCAQWALAQSAKRPAVVNRSKGWARQCPERRLRLRNLRPLSGVQGQRPCPPITSQNSAWHRQSCPRRPCLRLGTVHTRPPPLRCRRGDQIRESRPHPSCRRK